MYKTYVLFIRLTLNYNFKFGNSVIELLCAWGGSKTQFNHFVDKDFKTKLEIGESTVTTGFVV